jgi:hypothetical protein
MQDQNDHIYPRNSMSKIFVNEANPVRVGHPSKSMR